MGDLNVSDATWDADGHILFTRGEELWSADFNGSEERFLVKLPGIPYALRASPDCRVIRFTLAELQTHSTSLWEVSRDGKNRIHCSRAGLIPPANVAAVGHRTEGITSFNRSETEGMESGRFLKRTAFLGGIADPPNSQLARWIMSHPQ